MFENEYYAEILHNIVTIIHYDGSYFFNNKTMLEIWHTNITHTNISIYVNTVIQMHKIAAKRGK